MNEEAKESRFLSKYGLSGWQESYEDLKARWRRGRAAYRLAHPDKVRSERNEWAAQRKKRERLLAPDKYKKRRMLAGARKRSKESGVPYSLPSPSKFIWPSHCEITGIEFDYSKIGQSANSPSLDRIIPSLGYTVENVRVISLQANVIKNNCTDPALFKKIAEYIERNTTREVRLCMTG